MANNTLRLMDLEIRRLERIGVLSAKKIATRYVNKTLKIFLNTGVLDASSVADQLHKPLADTMITVSLMGQRRSQLIARKKKKKVFALSTFKEVQDILKKQLDIDAIDEAQEIYETEALRVLNDVTQDIEVQLRKTVNEVIESGLNRRDATRVIRLKFDTLGLTPKNSYQIEGIFRTQSQIAYQAGRWKAEQDPDVQEILWGYRYMTAKDERVRPSHVVLHGITLPKDDKFWGTFWPPNGWSCRCQVLSLFNSARKKQPPKNAAPDEGFSFNPGLLFG